MPVSEPQPGHARRPLPVLVGVDAGATKTIALAVAPDGERLGRAETEGANPKRHGLDVAADRIAAVAVRAVAAKASAPAVGAAPGAPPPVGLASGTAPAGEGGERAAAGGAPALLFVAGAGIDRPEHARAIEDELARRLPGTRIVVVNDTLAVLRAGTPDAVGLVVPVSTGGNVIGRAADGRVTDRGHGIFGGGYVLGALAARAARRGGSAAAPPLGSPSVGRVGPELAEQVAAAPPLGSPSVGRVGPELAEQVAAAHLGWHGRRPAPEAARLASAVVAAAQAGDPYPVRMVGRWCTRVEAAVREEVERLGLGPSPVVILYGGLLEASPWLATQLREAVLRGAPGARIRGLDSEPVDGAVLLARDAWAGRPVDWDFTPRR